MVNVGSILMKNTIEELDVKDIEEFRIHRKNTRESNHPYGTKNYMDILISGSKKLNKINTFAEYKINLGDDRDEN